MKKNAAALMASLFVSVMTAIPVLADSSLPRPHAGGVGGAGGIGGTAFTGANLSPIMLVSVLLAIVGVTALILARRYVTS